MRIAQDYYPFSTSIGTRSRLIGSLSSQVVQALALANSLTQAKKSANSQKLYLSSIIYLIRSSFCRNLHKQNRLLI